MNTSSIIYRYILILFLKTMNLGCKDKVQKPQEDLGFASLGEAKDYLFFKPGSWWIYKNSYTNELDTMILTNCFLDTLHAENSSKKLEYEVISYTVQSLRDNAEYVTNCYEMNIDLPRFRIAWAIECERIRGKSLNYHIQSDLSNQFYYPFDDNGRGGATTTYFKERIDSLLVNGEVYRDIVSFTVEHDGTYPYPNKYILDGGNSIYYWAKNYGIIKIQNDTWDAPSNGNKVQMNWTLIESHIIK